MGEIIDIEKKLASNPIEVAVEVPSDRRDFTDSETPVTSNDQVFGAQARRIAQELHTAVYLKMGYITEDDLNEDGIFLDKYTSRSTYIVSGGRVRLSACRYIAATENGGIASLPTIENFSIDASILPAVARASDLSDISYDEIVEVSGLVSISLDMEADRQQDEYDATQLMYATALRESLERGHRLWILNTNPRLLRAFAALVGGDQIHILGRPQRYMHITTIPAAMSPQGLIEAVMHDKSPYGEVKRTHLIHALQGMDVTHISPDMKLLLAQHGVEFELTQNT